MPLSHLLPAVVDCLSPHRLAVINQSINHLATEMWKRVDWSTGTGHPWSDEKVTRPSVLKTCNDYLKMNSECTILMQISQNFEKRITSLYVHIVKRISFFSHKISVLKTPQKALRMQHFDKNFSKFSGETSGTPLEGGADHLLHPPPFGATRLSEALGFIGHLCPPPGSGGSGSAPVLRVQLSLYLKLLKWLWHVYLL